MPQAIGAIGGAIMSAGTAIGSAVGGLTLSGLATGASVLGAGLTAVGAITGSKTLQKVGMGFGIAGGAGLLANGLRGASAVTGSISKSGSLLQSNSIDDILSAPLKGSKLSGAAKDSFSKVDFMNNGAALTAADSFKSNTNKIGSNFSFDPDIEKSFFERANDTLTKYNPMLNIAGGMGQAYLMNEQFNLQKDLWDKRLNFDQQQVDLQKQAAQPIGLTFTPPQFTRKPLLLQQ
jgi:hypothetical protein